MSPNNSPRIYESSMHSYKQIAQNCPPVVVNTTKELNTMIRKKMKAYYEQKDTNKQKPGFIITHEIIDGKSALSYREVYALDLESMSDEEYANFSSQITTDPYLSELFFYSLLKLDNNEIIIKTINKK
jgi:hypothetical protein